MQVNRILTGTVVEVRFSIMMNWKVWLRTHFTAEVMEIYIQPPLPIIIKWNSPILLLEIF